MSKAKLVYILSLRNAAADKAGQHVAYKGTQRYMTSPLEYLAHALDDTPLGDAYALEGIVIDDDPNSPRDQAALQDYGFACQPGKKWIFPADLKTQGKTLTDLFHAVPSEYRRLPLDAAERVAGKRRFENTLLDKLLTLQADIVVLDGLLVILDELVRPGAPFHRKIVNIHPGITRSNRPTNAGAPTPRSTRCTVRRAARWRTGRRWKPWPCRRCSRPAPRCTTWTTASTPAR